MWGLDGADRGLELLERLKTTTNLLRQLKGIFEIFILNILVTVSDYALESWES